MRKLLHQEILARQAEKSKLPSVPITVVLNDIRSLHNVGSIFRTSDGAGVEKIWLGGITGAPPHPQISKTALGAEDRLAWEYCQDVISVIKQYTDKGYEIVVLEQAEGSIPYCRYEPQGPVCLVVGNEVQGIDEGLLPFTDRVVEIEMRGVKNSLNVAVAFGIVVYHIQSKMLVD